MRSLLTILLAAVLLFAFNSVAMAQAIPGKYIVVLKNNVAEPNDVATAHGLSATHRYTSALKGFAAGIPQQALQGLLHNPNVLSIQPDRVVQAVAETVPTGVARINAYPASQTTPVDAGVAVIDTGIDLDHPDLNVVYGVNCLKIDRRTGDCKAGGDDDNGHGSHVAGTIGATDTGSGVVGVAPGVRLYAVKVLNSQGSGTLSSVIQGIDWVTRNAASRGIEVVNMSLGGSGSDDTDGNPNGCQITTDAEHLALCALVGAGVTVVVAAGNESDDTAYHTPGAFDEVIAVSALADFDGTPGGTGSGAYYFSSCSELEDDSLACFSNYGHDVDIMAPGVGILSTYMRGGYAESSGTSMACPHVAGAAALIVAESPATLTPDEVKAALLANADPAPCAGPGGICPDDPDGIQEPLLMVAPPAPPCTLDSECDDGVFCNGAETCVSGACVPGVFSCDDGIACTVDSCDEGLAACTNVPNDSLCNDGNACSDDACVAGVGCQNTANTNACDDGDACTAGDACFALACMPGTDITACIDGDGCCPAGCDDSNDNDCQPYNPCGDGYCAGFLEGETCDSCAADCACSGPACRFGCCGDGVCGKKENAADCPVDCQ